MASLLSILSAYSHVLSFNNKTANLKTLFAHSFDIQTANFDLFNKWVTHRFNSCAATNIEDYEF